MKNLLFLITAAALLFACRKNPVETSERSATTAQGITNYTTLDPASLLNIYQNADATLYTYSYSTYKNYNYHPVLTAYFKAGITPLESSLNGMTLYPSTDGSLTLASAQKNMLSILSPYSSQAVFNFKQNNTTYTATVPVPLADNLVLPEQDVKSVYAGKTIRWMPSRTQYYTKDVTPPVILKPALVLISISYDPNAPENNSTGKIVVRVKPVVRNILLNDTGSYTFTAADVQICPVNKSLAVDIYRGRYNSQQVSGKNFLTGGFTAVQLISMRTR